MRYTLLMIFVLLAPSVGAEASVELTGGYRILRLYWTINAVEEGRVEFERCIQGTLDRLEEARDISPASPQEFFLRANSAASAGEMLNVWYEVEACLRAEGQTTPEAVKQIMAENTIALIACAREILEEARSVNPNLAYPRGHSVLRLKGRMGKLLPRIVLLTRDTNMEQARRQIFKAAKEYIPLPETLQGFDNENPDAAKSNRLCRPSFPPTAAALARDAYSVFLDLDNYPKGCLSFCSEQYRRQLITPRAMYSRWKCEDVKQGKATVFDLGSDTYQVNLEIVCTDPQGQEHLFPFHVALFDPPVGLSRALCVGTRVDPEIDPEEAGISVMTPVPTPMRFPTQFREVKDDEPMGVLVKEITTRRYTDWTSLEPLCVEGYWPETEFQESALQREGYQLKDTGRAYVRQVDADDFEVEVRQIVLVDPNGKDRIKWVHYVLRRLPDGSFRISAFGRYKGHAASEETGGANSEE